MSALERTMRLLELLARHPEGRPLSALASDLDLPVSATHRLLSELARLGYVHQDQSYGRYALAIKLVALGLGFLTRSGVVDIAQPSLDRLAQESGELVRLAIVDGDELIFVAKAQGATHGVRYDPDMGLSVPLSCSAAGHAWLSTLSEEQALERIARHGFGEPALYGPKAPTTIKSLLPYLRRARSRGYSTISEVYAPGMAAMSAPVRNDHGAAIGVITIAGPVNRLSEARMDELGPALLRTAEEVGQASIASELLKPRG